MPDNIISNVEEFTDEGAGEQPTATEAKHTETETPSESSTDENQPGEEIGGEEKTTPVTKESGQQTESTEDLERETEGLRRQKEELDAEIVELRRKRRELREGTQEVELATTPPLVTEQTDDLSDLDPDDVKNFERILKAKGYARKEDIQASFTKDTEQEVIEDFLEEHPEYKPENDPNDINWEKLRAETRLYARPTSKAMYRKILSRAHKAITPVTSVTPQQAESKKQAVKKAGLATGGGATRKSSPSPTGKLTPEQKTYFKGFSDKELEEL